MAACRASSPARLLAGVAIVLVGQLAGCGGKGTSPPAKSLPPTSQLLFSTTEMSEPVSIASDGSHVYFGSMNALSQMDKVTSQRESLSGGLLDPSMLPTIGLGVVEHASDIIRSGDWLYFHSWGYRIQRLFMGPDGTAPIEEILPAAGLWASCCQLADFAVDDQRIYWVMWDGNSSFPLYSRGLDGGTIRTLATFTAAPQSAGVQITPAAGFVYAVTVGLEPTLTRVDVTSGAQDVVQAGLVLGPNNLVPRAASPSRLFWMDGTTLRSVAHGSLDPQVISTGLTAITQLTTDGASVYALDSGAAQDTIVRIDVASGSATPVVTGPDIRGILAYEGRIWWVDPWSLHASELDGTSATPIYDGDLLFDGAPLGVSGRVVAPWSSSTPGPGGLLVFDVADATTTLISGVHFGNVAVNANSLYVEDGNVRRIPVDAPVRVPETLARVSTVEAMILDQDWLYWSEYSDFGEVYRISRMKTDGTGREVLFDGVHRQLALLDGRLFFLCEAACALPGWSLVSMPFEGGPITLEASAGLHPQRLIARNGLLYLLDTDDGLTFGVWAIDVARGRSANVVSDLPWSGHDLDASSRWLYVWHYGSCRVDRRRIEAWDRLGAPQLVDEAASCQNPVFTFHSDGTDLYYWLQKDGLKKCAE
jgi:hypothetical protein